MQLPLLFHLNSALYIIHRFYFGIDPQLVIFDLDILKQVLVKEFDSFMDRPVSTGCTFDYSLIELISQITNYWPYNYYLQRFPDLIRRKPNAPNGLLQECGEAWKASRRTLSPTFSAAKMKMVRLC